MQTKNFRSGVIQLLLILDLWGISFHAVVVFGLGKNILFKSILGHCVACHKKLEWRCRLKFFTREKMFFEIYDDSRIFTINSSEA